jgi:zinc transporter 9
MASGSKLAVYTAIGANSLVTVAKFAGFCLTGSGALLSEAVHSLADVGNQTLLAVGMKRSQKAPDQEHPFGYGQEAFIWALISAVGMFFLGCGVSLAHGIQSVMHGGGHGTETHSSYNLSIYILLFALVIEGGCLGIAIKSLMGDAKRSGQSFREYLRTTDDPFGVAVLLEDGGAVLGVLIALSSVALAKYFESPIWDAVGTIGIGILLGFMAVYLVAKNRTYLVGKAISVKDQQALMSILEADPIVEDVAVQRAMVVGTESYKISAEIDLDGRYMADRYLEKQSVPELLSSFETPEDFKAYLREYSENLVDQVGDEIDRIETKIREVLPKAKDIDLEPN